MTIDPEPFAQWKAGHGKPPAAATADLRGGPALLTPTMKLRCHIAMKQYAAQIAALYDDRTS